MMLDGKASAFNNVAASNLRTADDADAAEAAVVEIKKAGNDFLKVHTTLPREAYFKAVKVAGEQGLAVAGHVPIAVSVAEAAEIGQHTVEHLSGVAIVCSKSERQLLLRLRAPETRGKGLDGTTGWRIDVEAHMDPDAKKAAALFQKFIEKNTWHVPTLIQTQQMAFLARADAIPAGLEQQLPVSLRGLWKRTITPEGACRSRFPCRSRLPRRT
jgi:hypothetical protein